MLGNQWIKKERAVLPDGREWWGPHPKQQEFLLHTDTREVFYGGAGGGGKSQALWYGALQFVDVPGYAALFLRRTYADLAKPGALMDRSKEYLHGTGAVWNERDKQWRFPGGGVISFGYMEHENDKLQYKSAEYQYIAFDELTDFSETQYTFLFTRLRKKKAGRLADVPLRMRSASNPGGPGHTWVYRRFVDPKTRQNGRVYIPARMTDNPSLDVEGYKESLSNTDPLTRAKIERGDWSAIEGGRFKADWFRNRYTRRGDYLVLKRAGEAASREYHLWSLPRYITVDPAASAKTTADYTVAGCWAETPQRELVLLDCIRFQAEIPDIVPRLLDFWGRWRTGTVGIESVASNSGVFQLANRTRLPAKPLSPLGQDKLVRATPAMNLAESGRIWLPAAGVVPGLPLDDIESEWFRFTGDEKQDDHDDCVDCCPEGTMIRAGDGLKPIEEVQVGDMVLTHVGRYQPVTSVMSRTAPALYRIRVAGRPDLVVTGNHRVLCHTAVRRVSRNGGLGWSADPGWLSVDGGLAAGKHGLTAVWYRGTSDRHVVDLLPFAPAGTRLEAGRLVPTTYGGARVSPTGNRILRHLDVDERFCWILGYYAAEGTCGRHQVSFASSSGEEPLHAAVAEWAASLGLTATTSVRGGAASTAVGSVTLRNWFAASFGSKDGKHLPVWVEALPVAKQWAVLSGYLAGDGHFGEAGVQCSSISRLLATQMYEIGCRLGLGARIRRHPKARGLPQWHVQWSRRYSAEIVARTPEWMTSGKRVRWTGETVAVADQTHVRFVADRLVGRIRSIERIDGPARVFNIAVQDDESYVAEGTVVHNCLSYAVWLMQNGCGASTPPPKILGGRM